MRSLREGAVPEGPFDVAVVGAGAVGCAVARELGIRGARTVLVEAGQDVGAGTSKANTAILHTGFDAKPGTVESGLVARGYALLSDYAERVGIPSARLGALMVAWTGEQREALEAVAAAAGENGYTETRRVDLDELYRREPNLGQGAQGALEIPGEGIVCPFTTTLAYATEALRAGCELVLNAPVSGARTGGGAHELDTARGPIRARHLVNAAGLRSDEIDAMLGHSAFTVRPRRGELIVFDKLARGLVNHVLLPVPTEKTKGVLVSPTVYGNVLLGPTADDVDDKADRSTTAAGLASLMEAGSRIVPGLTGQEVTATYVGLRAATESRDYQLRAHPEQRYVCAGGIRSTGITASLAIAEWVAEALAGAGLALGEPAAPGDLLMPNIGEFGSRPYQESDRIAGDPDYGRIVCFCERVTRGEIGAALAGPIPPVDVDGLRRRTRTLMGRCQGFFCAAEVADARVPRRRSRGGTRSTAKPAIESGPVIVGGGPSGLAAAVQLRRLEIEPVTVIEREREAGGIPRHSDHTGFGLRDLRTALTGPRYAARYRRLAEEEGVEVLTETMVTGWEGARGLKLTGPLGRWEVEPPAVVLATGCRERPRSARLVPGSRPAGVMTTSTLQQLVHLHDRKVGSRAVIVGAEHVSFSAIATLADGGATVAGMVTELPRHQSLAAFRTGAALRYRARVWPRTKLTAIHGAERVECVELTDLDSGEVRQVECDLVIFTADWIPDHELAVMAGCELDSGTLGPVIDPALRTTRPGVFASGNLLHPAETADICALDGRHVAASVAAYLRGGGEWPMQLPVVARDPLAWVAPNLLLSGGHDPPRRRFLLRSHEFIRRPRIRVRQGRRELWSGRLRRLVPGRSAHIPAGWGGRVDPEGGTVTVSVE